MSQKPSYSRFTIRRRIIEVAIVLWVIAYLNGFFDKADQQPPASRPAPAATASQTPVTR